MYFSRLDALAMLLSAAERALSALSIAWVPLVMASPACRPASPARASAALAFSPTREISREGLSSSSPILPAFSADFLSRSPTLWSSGSVLFLTYRQVGERIVVLAGTAIATIVIVSFLMGLLLPLAPKARRPPFMK